MAWRLCRGEWGAPVAAPLTPAGFCGSCCLCDEACVRWATPRKHSLTGPHPTPPQAPAEAPERPTLHPCVCKPGSARIETSLGSNLREMEVGQWTPAGLSPRAYGDASCLLLLIHSPLWRLTSFIKRQCMLLPRVPVSEEPRPGNPSTPSPLSCHYSPCVSSILTLVWNYLSGVLVDGH